MTQLEIEIYQAAIKRWQPKADVTMKDVVVHGEVSECVIIANNAIILMMNSKGNIK